MEKNIYNLKLHESLIVTENFVSTLVLRVPNGWVYTALDKSRGIMSSVFVPINDEFEWEYRK